MEVIRKKICIKDYISRIPSLIESLPINNSDSVSNNSWGRIPKNVRFGKESESIKYGTLINLYNRVYKLITNSFYYEYDESGKKWLIIDLNIKDILTKSNDIKYFYEIPKEDINDGDIIGILTEDDIDFFYNSFNFLKLSNGFDFLKKMDRLIGKKYVPDDIDGVFVPNYIYLANINELITKHSELSVNENSNCCERKQYDEYGGDKYQEFLLRSRIELNDFINNITNEFEFETPTLDIPILLTQNTIDLGQFKSNEIDVLYSDEINDSNDKTNNIKPSVVITSGESKLTTLRKRKRSYDDDGNELPFIYKDNIKTESPYQIDYIKNIQSSNNNFYGDLIHEINEKCEPIFVTEDLYKQYIDILNEDEITSGTVDEPLDSIGDYCTNSTKISISDDGLSYDEIVKIKDLDFYNKLSILKYKLIQFYKTKYPKILCLKQEYKYTYLCNNNEIIEKGVLYLVFDKCEITFTYVLGGKLKYDNKTFVLDEKPPYGLGVNNFKGCGMWYKETYSLRKVCINTFKMNNNDIKCRYDEIDFESKYSLDNPVENYILCTDIRYRGDSYLDYSTNDFVFRDEKMLGLSLPLKEKYDVNVQRGSYRAFDRHIQLGEIKTFDDLENYRNGMFLNK